MTKQFQLKKYCVPPRWIQELPPGEYDIKMLMERTKLKGGGIAVTLSKYGAVMRQVPSGYRNLVKNIYVWEGYRLNE